MERNWRRWKGWKPVRKGTMKMIPEEEKVEEENSGIRKEIEENNNMGNIVDPYYEL